MTPRGKKLMRVLINALRKEAYLTKTAKPQYLANFDMTFILMVSPIRGNRKLIPGCNTTGCALGLAGLLPEFNKVGLKFHRPDSAVPYLTYRGVYSPEFSTAAKLFGISITDAKKLFGDWKGQEEQYGHAGEWACANRLEKFLEAQP